MKNSSLNNGRGMMGKLGAWLALAVTVVALATPKAEAGAVATDSRNCAWGTASSYDGSASQQLTIACNRAINRGGSPTYIRSYQFSVPRGCYAAYATGYVSGKGWCGNWSYDPNPNVAGQKACDGMFRQGASSVVLRKVWLE